MKDELQKSYLEILLKIAVSIKRDDITEIATIIAENGLVYIHEALRLACKMGSLNVAKYCIANGADINHDLVIALENSIRSCNEELTLLMIKNGVEWQTKRRLMMIAASSGQINLLKFMIESADLSDDEIREIQRIAADQRQLEVLKIVISKLNKPNDVGAGSAFVDDSALLAACFQGHNDIAMYLIGAGALKVPLSITALGWAAYNDMKDVVRAIVDVQKPGNVQLAFPLYMAIQRQRFAIIDFLVGQKVPIEQDIIVAIQENFEAGHAEKWERLIEYIAESYPEYRFQISCYFTPKLNQKYPEYKTGVDFKLI
ncbi:MAG: hypothetical protein NTU44_15610 [Bacteroidetes bacterium]|nr:hypothetical protein [Bacteroidota bacterium]